MEQSKYDLISCNHTLSNGFTAWQFQSEEQSNLGGAIKVSMHVCLLCGEISIGGYRPGKDKRHSNSFHETFNISHPLAIDAIIKQANLYNEAKWYRADDYAALQTKCESLEKSCNEKNAIITSLNNLTTNLQAKCERYEAALSEISGEPYSIGQEGATCGDSKYDSVSAAAGYNAAIDNVTKIAREALSAWEKELEKPNNDMALYETRLAMRMLLKVFKSVEKSPEQEKYYSQADYIFKKHHNVINALRSNQKESK